MSQCFFIQQKIVITKTIPDRKSLTYFKSVSKIPYDSAINILMTKKN